LIQRSEPGIRIYLISKPKPIIKDIRTNRIRSIMKFNLLLFMMPRFKN
jgi:hypothetical protein